MQTQVLWLKYAGQADNSQRLILVHLVDGGSFLNASHMRLPGCRRPVQVCVMTSSATAAETEAFFRRHGFFDLAEDQTHFFQQVRLLGLC